MTLDAAQSKLLHEFLVTELIEAFPDAMPALVEPKRNAILAAKIPVAENELQMKLPKASADSMNCLRAGLWLLADDLDTAHKLCQDVPTNLGSAWHAHLHRREGDFWNSNYWWRRANNLKWKLPEGNLAGAVHGLLIASENAANAEAARWAAKLSGGNFSYDPTEFVAAVEKVGDAKGAWGDLLRDVQRLEWLALFYASVQAAK
jgi:hypothetical protein